ncbi:34144_t:CDS:2, partial [Gigaspora margarita]
LVVSLVVVELLDNPETDTESYRSNISISWSISSIMVYWFDFIHIVNTTKILKKVRDQEKFKKLSNNVQNEIYRLHVISLFHNKGVNMYAFETELKKNSPYIFI